VCHSVNTQSCIGFIVLPFIKENDITLFYRWQQSARDPVVLAAVLAAQIAAQIAAQTKVQMARKRKKIKTEASII
jgi:hypothetical protein